MHGQGGPETFEEAIGHVAQIGGAKAALHIRPLATSGPAPLTVGRFLGIRCASSIVVGIVTGLSASRPGDLQAGTSDSSCTFDLMGELRREGDGGWSYARGIVDYPALGAPAFVLDHDELEGVFGQAGRDTITIGTVHQDATVEARVRIDDMLAKHFAVLGSTGVGKSSGVSVIVGELLKARPDLRIFFIDPHNEYGSCFAEHAEVLTPRNLKLPFWLFNFEEFVDVLFRGRPGLEEETAILAELIPVAKASCLGARAGGDASLLRKVEQKASGGVGPDTPVPYRLADLVALIEERRGKLDNRALVAHYNKLLSRIETVRNDLRYAFMFEAANVGGDSMVDVIAQLFRLPTNGRPMTVMQLAGFPTEVVDSVVSVLCRMAFEFGLWSDGAAPMLVVCEEAHRYAPAERSQGFGPTRKAISRIAKEGRKYGVYLGLVTQRPAELDQTIVSQCNTIFCMRMANDRDQNIVRAAVSDAAASLLAFVPSLGSREVFAFGEGLALPTRMRFLSLPPHRIPSSEAVHRSRLDRGPVDRHFLNAVVERWRGAMLPRQKSDDGLSNLAAPAGVGALQAQVGEALRAPPVRNPNAPPVLDDTGSRTFGFRGR